MKSPRNLSVLFFFLLVFYLLTSAESFSAVSDTDRYDAISDSITALRFRGDLEGAKKLLGQLGAELENIENVSSEYGRQTLYQSWGDIVATYFNRNQIIEAVEEVQQMQDFAIRTSDELGMAYVDQTYGGLYTYNFEESINHLRRALDYWERTDNKNGMQNAFYMLSREALGLAESTDSLDLQHQLYADVLGYADNIETLAKEAKAADPQYFADYSIELSEFLRMQVYLAIEDKANALSCFDRINSWFEGDKLDPRIKGMMAYVMADYLIMYENPKQAESLIAQINLQLQRLEMEKRLCQKTGNYTRAIELQKQLDKLNRQRTNQLQQTHLAIANAAYNNLRLEREKHQLEMEGSRRSMILNIVIIIAVSLIIVVVSLVISQRRVLRKNRDLVQRIKAQEDSERKSQSLSISMAERLSQEEQLFLRIEKLLQENTDILTDPELNRDTLASHLGTNRTYIAQAIATCADGISVSEYVNRQRLQYARQLLSQEPEMSIDQIVASSGFGSRSRFHHLFVSHYGMTPLQFRKAAKD